MKEKNSIIPAQEGWFVCEPCYTPECVEKFHKTPIVAWDVLSGESPGGERYAFALPVIHHEMPENGYFICGPSGLYDQPGGAYGLTEFEALAIAQKELHPKWKAVR